MTNAESSSPFRPLSLSRTDTKELQALAKTILNANFDQYLHFSGVDANIWKLIKSKDQMRVYGSQATENRKVEDDSDLQSLLFVGYTPGTLKNLMEGVVGSSGGLVGTSDFSGAAVLSTIKEPSPIKPFQSIAVKWAELDVRRRSMRLVKNRDYVYLEATGVETLPNGEHLGYHLMHSVDVPAAHDLPGRVRAKLSVCSFFRQANENVISVYSRAMTDPTSNRARRVVVPRFAKALLSTFTCDQGGKMQKLVQTLGKSYRELESSKPLSSNVNCTTCSKRVWRLGKLAAFNNSCMLCSEHVCSSCKIDKKVKTRQETTRKVTFCFSCLTDVMATDESEFSFAEDSSEAPEVIRPTFNSVWTLRAPSWSLSKKKEARVDFASTRYAHAMYFQPRKLN